MLFVFFVFIFLTVRVDSQIKHTCISKRPKKNKKVFCAKVAAWSSTLNKSLARCEFQEAYFFLPPLALIVSLLHKSTALCTKASRLFSVSQAVSPAILTYYVICVYSRGPLMGGLKSLSRAVRSASVPPRAVTVHVLVNMDIFPLRRHCVFRFSASVDA